MVSLKFTGRLTKKRNAVVAHCPELDVYSQGYSEGEARNNLREAVRLFLEEAGRMGTLEQILEEAGFYQRARFDGYYKLKVEGRLNTLGEPDNMITFTTGADFLV